MTRVPAPFLALAAMVSVQLGAAIAKTRFDEVGSVGAATLRLVIGAVVLALVVRPRVRHWTRAQWTGAVTLGVALAGMNLCIYVAFASIPIGVAVTIEFLGPLALSLVHTRRWRDALWAALALVGVVLLGVGPSAVTSVSGVVFAVLAAGCWAGYIVMNRHVGRAIPGVDGLAVSMLVAMVVALPFGLGEAVRGVGDHPSLLLVFTAVAVLSSVLPYALEMLALRRMPTRVFGVLQSLGPAIAALAGLVVLAEGLSVLEVGALACVTAASVGVTLSARRRRA
ncbi:inner membrane transporter RhtA [Curtobacterium luteum]|uniref:Inner membrane transporter RhtA n=1 Tax=Curtobacterium luteum TaxID=33881 RepID=A0A8H9GDK0_9MICO|nr:EamA family transporter [Curtobacterium luteum]MBM7800916.1 inner membrane transporter RhtA [Curtobacterium luteum]NUU49508.1 EamA family transporter [Curtobacterium luteum]GGL09728.1 threonine transporter RhtB [Curtobacterium luteum]